MTTSPMDAYLARLNMAGMRPNTIKVRRKVLTAFGATVERGLLHATRLDVEAYLGRPLATESRRAYLDSLRGFYRWAVEEELRVDDPTARIPNVKVRQGTPRPVPSAELDRALAMSDRRMRAWLLLMALGGLRCIEVSHLRPADLMPASTGTLLYLRECKGGGTATVPAHPTILEGLAVLPIRDGLWWSVKPHGVSAGVSAHFRACGIDGGAHRLRHFAGTAFYRASGHDLLATAQLLRHANVNNSMIYAQLDPVRPAEVVNAVPLRLVESA